MISPLTPIPFSGPTRQLQHKKILIQIKIILYNNLNKKNKNSTANIVDLQRPITLSMITSGRKNDMN